MEIKKIYEIQKRTWEGKTIMRCTDILNVDNKADKRGFYKIYESEYHDDIREFLVHLEGEKSYTLIDKNANIIHKGIPAGVNKVTKADLFRIYFNEKERRLVAIGSTTNIDIKNTNYYFQGFDIDVSYISTEWIELGYEYGKSGVYYRHKLLIIMGEERNMRERTNGKFIYIYCADNLSEMQKVELADTKVIARFENAYGIGIIRIIELDQNGHPAKEYLFSVDDGKQIQLEVKKV